MYISFKSFLPFIFVTFLVGCGGGGGGSAAPVVEETPAVEETPEFAVTSANYTEGSAIPLLHACNL